MNTQTLSRRSDALPPTKARRRFDAFPFLLLLPSALLIALINIYPFTTGFYYSLQNGTLLQSGQFVGLANFVQLFSMPEFQNALRFSAIFALFSVCGSWLVGLLLALLPCCSYSFRST